jgi:DNA polymerase III sliding clamp (beta) subunit (PCNA family)
MLKNVAGGLISNLNQRKNMNTEITLPASELKAALPGLSKVVSRKSGLPVLQNIKVSRQRNGLVTLQATDLDAFATYTITGTQPGQPVELLVPMEQLNHAFKCCGSKNDVTLLCEGNETKLRYYIGGNPVSQPVTVTPVNEWPPAPQIKTESFELAPAFGLALKQALASCGEFQGRSTLRGACLDVTDQALHYVVGSDGRSLFAANSFTFPLKESVIIPGSKFLGGSDLLDQGPCLMAVQPGKGRNAVKHICLQTPRWQFITREVEGQFPVWKKNIPTPSPKWTHLKLGPSAVSQLLQVVPRLPGDDNNNHPVRLRIEKGLWVEGRNKNDQDWTQVAVAEVTITGKPQLIQLNRNYLLQALRFGLDECAVESDGTPIVFTNAGRKFVVMPVYEKPVEQKPSPPVPTPPVKPSATQTSSTPPETKPAEERKTQMPRTAAKIEPTQTPEPSPTTSLIGQIETIRDTLKNVIRDLNTLVDSVKLAEKEKRASEKEVQSVRTTLKKLQQVTL